MPLYIAQSGDLDRCYRRLTDSQTLKDRATQLLVKYKSGTLVTRFCKNLMVVPVFFCILVFSTLFVDSIIISKI